jgi:hypothetical protein
MNYTTAANPMQDDGTRKELQMIETKTTPTTRYVARASVERGEDGTLKYPWGDTLVTDFQARLSTIQITGLLNQLPQVDSYEDLVTLHDKTALTPDVLEALARLAKALRGLVQADYSGIKVVRVAPHDELVKRAMLRELREAYHELKNEGGDSA